MKSRIIKIMTLLFIVSPASQAHAASASVKIKTIVADYMPDQIRFQADGDIGSCNEGQWLDRFGNGSDEVTKRENNKIVYSSLLAALMSGNKVNIYVSDTSCQVENLQFSNE